MERLGKPVWERNFPPAGVTDHVWTIDELLNAGTGA